MSAPVVVDFNAPSSVQENTVNTGPQFLLGTTTVTDAEDDWSGGTLVISGLAPDDLIFPLNFGTGWGEPSYNSVTGEVAIGGLVIGVASGGAGTDFVVTFNANATAALISTLLMSLQYQNLSNDPTQFRELSVTLTDAAGEVALVHVEPHWEQVGGGDDPFASLPWIDARLTPAFADIDGDGDLDAIVGTYNGPFAYLENTGTASAPVFELREGEDNPFDGLSAAYETVPTFVDLDADGDLDMVAGGSGGVLRTYRNDGAGGFVDISGTSPLADISSDHVSRAMFGDLDGDGDLDLIVTNFGGFGFFYRNEGTAAAPQFTYVGVATGLYMASGGQRPTLHDVDGDGDLDVVAVDPLVGGIQYFENTGGAAVAAFMQQTGGDNPFDGIVPGMYGSVTFADLDGDGLDELIVGDSYGVLKVYRYDAGGDLPPTIELEIIPEPEYFMGHNGPDVATGTASADEMWGINGNDLLKGGGGDDLIYGGGDNDDLRGEDGDDTLDGSGGDDVLIGGNGDDTLDGGAGNDILKGGAGLDRHFGGDGDDTYYVDDEDLIYIWESADEGVDTVIFSGVDDVLIGANIENLKLTKAADIFVTGNALDNVITAVGGANIIHGMGGDDTIDGGAGDDSLYGWADDDHLIGFVGNDALYGGAGVDRLDGGAGNDILDGGTDADLMTGGAGNDTYYVDQGELWGGGPFDQVIEAAGGGNDTVYVVDTIRYFAGFLNVETYVVTGLTTIMGTDPVGALWNTGDNVYRAEGASAVLEVTDKGGNNTMYGGDGVDTLNVEGSGRNIMYGGDGGDRLFSGAGVETFYGENGNDLFIAGGGNDRGWGGAGNDTSYGDDGADVLYGDDGDDYLDGGTGNDTLWGGNDVDTLVGGDGADKLYGEDGGDWIEGRAGADTIDGGAGADYIDGGAGADRLTGGAGADRFYFGLDAVRLSSQGLTLEVDMILDFNAAEGDRIDLSDLDLTFVTRFTSQAGQAMLVYNATAGTTALRIDVDGDGKLDHQVIINGHLTASDPAWIL